MGQLWLLGGNAKHDRFERGIHEDNFDIKVAIVTLFVLL
jgi:hypothetical protein